MATELWSYRSDIAAPPRQLAGFEVNASDGHIGSIDDATFEVGSAYIVVDTGFWIFGKRRMIPAGAISEIDLDAETVTIARTKDEVKNAPDYDEVRAEEEAYRDEMDTYWGQWPMM
ncbi:MAG TPA: PRC-barrel domain-containing protein [Euzebya sp.]|nr:PRC-barrel domain-containing protein [Euzebya sp.]